MSRNRIWICQKCTLQNEIISRICVACNSPKPVNDNSQLTFQRVDVDNNIAQEIFAKMVQEEDEKKNNFLPKLKQVQRGLIKCNGDCGSKFAKIIENCVNSKIQYKQNKHQYETTIKHAFKYYNDPLRQSLLQLIRKRQLREIYQTYYDSLNDRNYVIENTEQIDQIIKLFEEMVKDDHKDILQQLANQTCHESDRSLLEEIERNTKNQLNSLYAEYEALQKTKVIYQKSDDKDKHILILSWIAKTIKQIEEKIKKEEEATQKMISNMDKYHNKLKSIKNYRKYKEMQQRNCTLNDLEILAVLFYCDEDGYCYNMRKSHRENENSCQWKNFYYYLCCAIDKMYYVFHYQNKKWFKMQRNHHLLSGLTICDLTKQQKQCLNLQTINSFSTSYSVAKGFARKAKVKPTDKQGMILVIDNGLKKLYDGKLRGADVSWLSKFSAEDEYILLPTIFKNFGYLKERQRLKRGWVIPEENHNMYVTADVKSTNISFITADVVNQLNAPLSWLPLNMEHYKYAFDVMNYGLHVIFAIFGHLKSFCCPACGVRSRCMEFAGDPIKLTVECPSCRAYVFRSQFINNENDRTFECNNHECGKMIRRCDLRKIHEGNAKGLDPEDGYQCVKCKKQQRIAYLDRVSNHEPTLNRKTDSLLNSIGKLVEINYEHEVSVGNQEYIKYPLEHFQVSIQSDRDELKKIIKFIHQKKSMTSSFADFFKEFPIIWKWLLSFRFFRQIMDAYKDGYTDLLKKGFINESNDILLNPHNAETVGSVIGKEVYKASNKNVSEVTVEDATNVAMTFVNMGRGVWNSWQKNNL